MELQLIESFLILLLLGIVRIRRLLLRDFEDAASEVLTRPPAAHEVANKRHPRAGLQGRTHHLDVLAFRIFKVLDVGDRGVLSTLISERIVRRLHGWQEGREAIEHCGGEKHAS